MARLNWHLRVALLLPLAAFVHGKSMAQATPQAESTAAQPALATAAHGTVMDPDAGFVGGSETVRTTQQLTGDAWVILTNAVTVSTNPQTRTQGLGGLGQLGSTPRSVALIEQSMRDRDPDVRAAAALAAAQTGVPALSTPLRKLLDDNQPEVALTAALALWKMNDRSGEDILIAVIDGQRSTEPGVLQGAIHSASRDLHEPGTLARMGATEGAAMLLGPFGIGLAAYEYLHKNGGDASRVAAVEDIAQNHTTPIRQTLVAALKDKDPGVRAAAAKALSHYPDPAIAAEISHLLYDDKPPVRFSAAAAYLVCVGAAVSSAEPAAVRAASVRRH